MALMNIMILKIIFKACLPFIIKVSLLSLFIITNYSLINLIVSSIAYSVFVINYREFATRSIINEGQGVACGTPSALG